MKHLIIITSALALLAGTISSASAGEYGGHGRGHRNRTVIIQQPQAFGLGVGVNLGAALLSQLLAQPQQCCQQVAEPLVFPDDPAPEPKKKFRRPPVEPKLRNPIPPG